MANLKIIQKKISTKHEGVFYKEVVNENNKVVDNIFLNDLRQLKSELFETLKQKKLSDGYKPRTVQLILELARQIVKEQ